MAEQIPIMMNDTLARQMARDHAYDRSLGDIPTQKGDGLGDGSLGDVDIPDIDFSPHTSDSFSNFLASIPMLVWILLGMIVLGLLAYWAYRSGLFRKQEEETTDESEEGNEEDDIHAIDFDHEMDEALRSNDYASIVRLVYLHTLHTLDERKCIKWQISKTPSEYAAEVNLPAFDRMTYHFLYVRYGKFPATSQMSNEMQTLRDEVLNTKGGVA